MYFVEVNVEGCGVFYILTSNHNVRASLVKAASVAARCEGGKSDLEQMAHYPNIKGSSPAATVIV
jgi:hypothetical protein